MPSFPFTLAKMPLALAFSFALSACGQQPTDSAPQTPESQALHSVFERATHSPLANWTFEIQPDAQQSPWYQISVEDNQLIAKGNSPSSVAYGTYQYMRQLGAMSVSWEGQRIALPEQLADYSGNKTQSQFDLRTYLNVCAYGYSMPWWGWDRWQQEIDWMAMHGVNNPVAMEGQEYVWQKLWQEFGVDNDNLQQYFSGPAFAPWQRMGNIEGHQGPLPQSWIDKKHALQKQILTRMQALGMQPVVPAFSGYVPKQFLALFPDAKITAMPKWTGFEHETYWLDPADPLFAKVAKRFIELYTQEYGEHQYYLSDAFNEMLPPVTEDNRYADLASYGERIYQSIQQVVPDATWVMQGWMFGADEEFWDEASIEAFLSKVPNQHTLIHDIGNDRYHVWQRTQGFMQKPWIFGFIHNYGGSDPVYGDFNDYVTQLNTVNNSPIAGNVAGFGVFPEGINNNSIVYEFLFDLPWQQGDVSTQTWLQQYTQARYGKTSDALLSAWDNIEQGAFGVRYWTSRWWEGSAGAYLLFKRPTEAITDFPGHPGDLAKLDAGIQQLLALAPQYQDAPLFTYDLVDLVKHATSLHVDLMLQDAVSAYQAKDFAKGDQLMKTIRSKVEKLDLLLGIHQESLTSWLTDAAAYADNDQERLYYQHNARLQITQWGGPKLKDYASKAWQGMYLSYYLPRWEHFMAQYKEDLQSNQRDNSDARQQSLIEWEANWIEQTDIPTHRQPKQPVALAQEIVADLGQ